MRPYTVLMIGWEYPPRITGGLAIACQGLARALAQRGHRILFLVPRLTGTEEREEGIHLLDLREEMQFFSPEETSRLRAWSEQNIRLSPYGRFAAESHSGATVESQTAVETTSGMLFPIEGGYGDSLYADIQTYAEVAVMMARRYQFDVIHAHDWITFPAGMAV
ncbi:MAG: glycogen/starch synthase, partial [Spirochaetia bacterium]|nr:glycogen/starch synthase [Spirochaetia bacterium]